MAEAGFFVEKEPSAVDARELLDVYLAQFNAAEQKRLQVKYLLDNAVYAMKPPFFNDPAARDYLESARELQPRSWQIWANLASVSLFTGNLERGRTELAKATELRGQAVREAPGVPYLAAALELSGIETRGDKALHDERK